MAPKRKINNKDEDLVATTSLTQKDLEIDRLNNVIKGLDTQLQDVKKQLNEYQELLLYRGPFSLKTLHNLAKRIFK